MNATVSVSVLAQNESLLRVIPACPAILCVFTVHHCIAEGISAILCSMLLRHFKGFLVIGSIAISAFVVLGIGSG